MADENPFSPEALERRASAGGEPAAAPEPGGLSPGQEDHDFFPGIQLGRPKVSGAGVAVRSAGGGVIPALAGIATGAATGAIGGSLAGPVGTLVGGLGGMIAGAYGGDTAQRFALKALPSSYQDALGSTERQQRLDEEAHPDISFMAGIAPYLVTMSPFGAAKAGLKATTALGRIMEHTATARLFGGLSMGGMELGQEAAQGDVNWNHVAIATGFGMVFNRPNRLGERIENVGRAGVAPITGRVTGRASYENREGARREWQDRNQSLFEGGTDLTQAPPGPDFEGSWNRPTEPGEAEGPFGDRPAFVDVVPTLSEAGDTFVMGHGITESVFHGMELQSPITRAAAYEAAMNEREALMAPRPKPVEDAAREMHPDLFNRYDELQHQAEGLRKWIDQSSRPTDQMITSAEGDIAALKEQLGETVNRAEQRRIRAQIRDAEGALAEARHRQATHGTPEWQETPDVADLREKWHAVDQQLRDLSPELSAAYRRAAEHVGGEMVDYPRGPELYGPPASVEGTAAAPPAAEAPPPAPTVAAPAVAPRPLADQMDYIRRDAAARLLKAAPHLGSDVADAFGHTVAHEIATWAHDWEGRQGTAEEIYHRESPSIRGPNGEELPLRPRTQRALELAQRAKQSEQSEEPFGRYSPEKNVMTMLAEANPTTAFHELSHSWLERWAKYAQRDDAPEAIKKDWDTLASVYGIKNFRPTRGERGQHERFARDVERFFYSGVAPNRELAGIFAKVKQWFRDVYETVKRMGKPINPEVEAVLLRRLSPNPERIVVGDHIPETPRLSDIHKADVAETAPEHADATEARVANEATQSEAGLPPEVRNELAAKESEIKPVEGGEGANAAGEAAARPGGDGAVENPVAAAGPEPEGGAGGQGTGDVVAGGSGPGREGGAARGGNEGAADAGGGPGPAGTAAGDFAPRPSPDYQPADQFYDLAGNIRLENITDAERLRDFMRTRSDRNEQFVDQRAGPTPGQMFELARAMGIDPKQLDIDWLAKVSGDFEQMGVKIARVRLLIEQSADHVSAMSLLPDSPENMAAFGDALRRHDMIQSTLSKMNAEWGRAGHAFRSLQGAAGNALEINQLLKEETGRDLNQLGMLKKLMSTMKDRGQVSKLTRDSGKRGFWNMLMEYWINNLISGPVTHATYMIGNELLALNKIGPETGMAALIGAVRRSMGREGETARLSDVWTMAKAHAESVGPALHSMGQAYKTGLTTRLPGEENYFQKMTPFQDNTVVAHPGLMNEAYKIGDVMPDLWGAIRGMKDGIKVNADIMSTWTPDKGPMFQREWSSLGSIPNLTFRGGTLPIGEIARFPSRNVAAIHSGFRATNFSMEKAVSAARQARAEGLTGNAADARIAELRQDPPDWMMHAAEFGAPNEALRAQREIAIRKGINEKAVSEATNLTLMSQGGPITQALSRLTNTPFFPRRDVAGQIIRGTGIPIFKFIDPFVTISSNILNEALVKRTPLGMFSAEIRADLLGHNGNIAQDMAQARMVMGSIYGIVFGALANEGLVSGGGPSDPHEAAGWRLAGNQPYSVRVGDTWYATHKLGALGMLLGVSADLYDVAHHAAAGEMEKATMSVVNAFAHNILEESFMRGPSELMKAIEEPERNGERWVSDFASSFVPFSVGLAQMARASDPYSRKAYDVVSAIKNKIPGMSESLLPRRDVWGEEIPNRQGLISSGLTAIWMQQISHDPVNIALQNLAVYPAPVPKQIRNVDLTDAQYDDFQRISGRMTKQRLDAMVNSPDWNRWPPHLQHDVIVKTIRQNREVATNMMLMKYPSIPHSAATAQRDRLQTSTPKKPTHIQQPQ